jgi:hypothetical protein
MARWQDVVDDASDFAQHVRRVFDERKHKALATLRKDGAPRISGIEVEFSDGEMWLGMMPGSLKARDVRRDPRLAIQAMSDDPPDGDPSAWLGDAKVAGRAEEVQTGDAASGHRFRVDVREVVVTRVGTPADHLLIESWHEGRGLTSVKRK